MAKSDWTKIGGRWVQNAKRASKKGKGRSKRSNPRRATRRNGEWTNDGRREVRVVSHQQGSWKWQLRGQRVEYRTWRTNDGRVIWRSFKVLDDAVNLGNMRDHKGRRTGVSADRSLHNEEVR